MPRGRPKNSDSNEISELLSDHFEQLVQNGQLVSSTSGIFSELGLKLGKNPKAMYMSLKREFAKNIPEYPSVEPHHQEPSSSSHESDENTEIKRNVIQFSVNISSDSFQVQNYLKKTRGISTVRKGVTSGWSDRLFEIIWKEKKADCAWSFRHAYVNSDDTITFDGICTECDADLRAITNAARSRIHVEITGYQNDFVHKKQRQVRGERRRQIAEKLKDKTAFKVRRELCDELIDDENEGLPPQLPSLQTLNQIKYESSIEQRSAIENILKWKSTSSSFRDTIFDVGCSPFYVKYQLPTQAEFYIKERQSNPKMAISIDATGSVVLPPKDSELSPKTQKPRHIFLYNIMAKTDLTSVPIFQMISQRQTAQFICYWLEELFTKMPPPSEVVCDGSKALILSLVKALTEFKTVNEYKHACIQSLEKGHETPKCFIRLDRSHFSHNVSKIIAYRNPLKRDLLRSTFGFLFQCESFDEAKILIFDLFTLIMNKIDGSKDGIVKPVQKSKINLQIVCATHRIEETKDIESENDMCDDDDDSANENENENYDWLKKILEKVPIVNENEWEDVIENAYYCAHDVKNFMRLLSDLPLWSNVLVNNFGSPYTTATSQDVESNFKTIKCLVLDQKMVRPDKFLVAHTNYLRVEIKTRIAELLRGRRKQRSSFEKGK